ncbi:MAG: hypothetical protein HY258_07900 [Chloroflexi bacterium]|nr:hypothetical protein [Chloroflexota bacterium]
MLNTDSDLGRHLTLGRIILETHQVPTHDVLSFTKSDQPRPPYEWFAQVLFALAFQLLNLDGVVLLTGFIIAATFLIVYADSVQRSNAHIVALALTAWAAIASSLHWLTRPHIFSFLFLSIWLYGLEKIRLKEKFPIWSFPALMLIWANTHGGFVFGFLAWLAYFAGWLWQIFREQDDWVDGKRLLLIGGTSLIASILTLDLWHNWEAVLNNRSAFILSRTVETMPPNFRLSSIWPFAGLLALTAVLAMLNRKKIEACHIFLLAGLGAMSLAVARNIPLFVIATTPILAKWMRQIFDKKNNWTNLEDGFAKIDSGLKGFLWPIVVLIAASGFLIFHKMETQAPLFQFDPQVFPVQAMDWVETHPIQGNMFNDFNWGGYLLYRLWPNQRVFLDSQSDFYGENFMRQYEEIYVGGKDWDAELAQFNVDWIIVPREAGLARVVRTSTSWQIVYEDPIAVIFVRR